MVCHWLCALVQGLMVCHRAKAIEDIAMQIINDELTQIKETRRSPLVGPVYSMNKSKNKLAGGPIPKGIKATVAVITVTASLIGAATTISSFAHSVAPRLAPAPIFGASAQVDPDYMAPLAALGADGRPLGQCPLSHTTMDAKLSGYVARVNVTQVFTNPYKERIEAVYSFPLSDDSAVDDMTIKIGERTIKGEIKTREAARQIYDNARNTGHTAALLNQERTNIFTQHVANIDPGKSIVVQLSYVELLKFEDGKYTFAMPTTIGPRFFPNSAGDSDTSSAVSSSSALSQVLSGSGLAVNSESNPKGRIEPTIATQNLSINVDVNAGMPIKNVSSKLFPIMVDKQSASHSVVSLQKSQNYPNKDFVMTYELENPGALKSGYLTYRDDTAKDQDGYATFMLLPPAKVTATTAAPKEMIFLIDCSGSQSGRPIEKAKEALHYIVNHMNSQDTFQILAFNDQVETLSERPIRAGMVEKLQAHSFISRLNATGGTWMAPAVERVLRQESKSGDDLKRLRIVTFMTDGYVGNDIEIMSLVQKERRDSRWFAFGTGDSVNRSLIDSVSRLGGGESDYVLLDSSAEEVGKKFYSRISSPALTDVKLKAEGIELYDVYPAVVSDVWANKPLYFTARYRGAGQGKVVLTGYANGRPYKQTLAVTLPLRDTTNSAIEKVWSRQKIDSLTDQDLVGLSKGQVNGSIREAITKVALDHKLMSDFTSFVAVDSAVYGGRSLLKVPVFSMAVEGMDSPAVVQSSSAPSTQPVLQYQPVSQYQPVLVSDGTAPILQGATNGMISPQGSESTVVNGVNTAGTVRVNYLADLEAQANLIANAIEILGIGWGSCTLIMCLLRGKSAHQGRRTKLIAAVIAIAIGLAAPVGLNWFLNELHNSCIFN